VGKGAYSADKDTVYMSCDLLNSDSTEAKSILTEEVDHAIDFRINAQDAKGDGVIYSSRLGFRSNSTLYSLPGGVAIPCNSPAITRHCALPRNE